jgi:hypothetical protein
MRREQVMQGYAEAYPYPLNNKGILEAIRFALLHEAERIPWAGPPSGEGAASRSPSEPR